jgi:uncharacterized protein (TIGR02117 family)
MRKILKFLWKTILTLITLLLLYLVTAFFLSRITVDEEPNTPDEIAIYILTNGVHTDIVMPTRSDQIDWSREIKYANTVAADSTHSYIAMGWGDKGFYLETPTWGDLKASTALKAASGLSTTAIHATYYQSMIEGESCKKIIISNEQYGRLVVYIRESFQQDAEGHFNYIQTDANYGYSDAFYEANGSYSLFTTCNTWANSALKASGQKACLWTAFDTGIFLKYEK